MKRKRPPRLVPSPAPSDIAGWESKHPPTWDCSNDVSKPGFLGTMIYAAGMLLALPIYWLAVFTMTLAKVEGLSPIHQKIILDPLIIGLMFISAFVAVCVLNWLASGPKVLGFCFDERQQRFTFTQRRPARQTTNECVPYSAIHYIKPYTLTTFANVSHFEVCYAGADGKPVTLRFWVDITVKEMAFHATWLAQSVDERMLELLDLDL
ncbi:hypothetical protein [Pseudomonas sp. Z4-20]|uniref:hypothetical protein n=1 Tax=Pseudomonas sp. Z4-20 TaxID=2817414 RepID=UPI003DA89DD6